MSNDRDEILEELRDALEVVRIFEARTAELEGLRSQPIAIVSMACRLPGGIESPEAYWELLEEGLDAVGSFPERWDGLELYDPNPDAVGKSYAREGGFLRNVELFDAGFFGTGVREARAMDPQHRVLLETAWEALERAGIQPSTLNESLTGVYVGCMGSDYSMAQVSGFEALDGYVGMGTATSVLSGRVAYVLGLQGPALTVDTACSSSLTALHLACTGLRHRECDLALVGGVTVMSTPGIFVEFSRLRAMSPDGRCKSFSARADGTGWSEGCGVLVLKRLPDAQRDGDQVLALVRGSAMNQDGRSQGMSAPNGPAQQRVIQDALASAGLSPCDLDALEAHGTGTMLGDPIEAGALAAVFGPERTPERPLYLGSAKSNLGHTQAAAGVAGVIKLVLALQHERMPKTLHAQEPSSHIAWEGSGLALLQEPRDWKRGERIRRAGVSSFGVSGTNVHVVIEEAPAPLTPHLENTPAAPVPYALPLLISGRDDAALRAQAQRLHDWLMAHPEVPWVDVIHTAALHRSHFDERAVVMAQDVASSLEGIEALAHGRPDPRVVRAPTIPQFGKIVFVFPGQGSQWPGMAKSLLQQSEVFAESMRACDAALLPWTGWSVLSLLRGENAARLPPQDRVDAVQTALFAMGVSLSALWRSLGVTPAAVVGHSQGEVTAAVVSGALSLEDGARVVVARSQAVRERCGEGGMLLVERPVTEVEARLERHGSALSIAAVNTASSTVVSGELSALTALKSELESEAVFCRVVNVDYASHSAQMDGLLPGLLKELSGIAPRAGQIPLYSTVQSRRLDGAELDGSYWCRNLREPVRFDHALSQLLDDGHRVFVEVSAHPVLGVALRSASEERDGVVLASLTREQGELSSLLRGLAELHVRGRAVDWKRVLGGYGGRRAELPTYAFQREPFWLDGGKGKSDARSMGLLAVEHPLLGALMPLAGTDSYAFSSRLSLSEESWLGDHVVQGSVLMPGTAWLELALHAARTLGLSGVSELTLEQPLVLTRERRLQLQLSVGSVDEQGSRSVSVYSREDERADWQRHACGMLASPASEAPETPSELDSLRSWPVAGAARVNLDEFYARVCELGLEYGPAFQGLVEAYRMGTVAYGRVVLPEPLNRSAEHYGVHPALLDAALHLMLLLATDAGSLQLPFAWSDVRLYATGASELRARMERTDFGVSLLLADGNGDPVASIGALQVRPARLKAFQATQQSAQKHLYRLELHPVALEHAAVDIPEGVVVGGTGALAQRLGASWYADFAALQAQTADTPAPARVIIDATSRANEGPLLAAVHSQTASALVLLQALLAEERLGQSELVWVTSSAVASGAEWGVEDLVHAPLWGLIRSARSEYQERTLRLVDLDRLGAERELLARGLSATREPELVLRSDTWLAARLCATRSAAREGTLDLPEMAERWQLVQREPGRLDSFEIVTAPDTGALGAQQVRVEIRAAGVNFRDALNALDMVQAPAFGCEFAGVVREVGADVTNVAVGQRVFGLGFGGFASEVCIDSRMLAVFPERLSFEQAATIPLVYLTAMYGFEDLCGLRAGDKVLIHAAAGGVGMAAVQLARAAGAEVFGTASEGKWWSLREQGLDDAHIASSRDSSFEQKILQVTGGTGVDVVLNALTKEFVDASLRVLPRGGCFLEMGKLDIRDAAEVGRLHAGVRYVAYDLMEAGLERICAMLEKLAQWLGDGLLEPLPFSAYDVRQAPSALRFIAQAKHVGKLVLQMPRRMEREGSVLITGGTGELGSALAQHLVARHGVRYLMLTSRRGADAPGTAELVAALTAQGAARVDVLACDVTERAQVAQVLAQVPAEHPLTGVFHLSAVLDDGMLRAQTAPRLSKVLAPKVDGAWHLHELTQGADLACFVVFSSAAGTLGNAGQSNYAAANAFVDALAVHRRKRGLAGMSLAWGLWQPSGVGLTGKMTAADLTRMARIGIAPLSQEQGLSLLDAALARPEPQLAPMQLDLATMQRMFEQVGTLPPLWAALLRPSLRRASASRKREASALRARLSALPPSERSSAIEEMVQGEIAAVLGLAGPSAVPVDRELLKLGLDSLMAVELRNRLAALAEAKLPATLAFDYPTPRAMAGWLLRRAFSELEAQPAQRKQAPVNATEAIAIVSMACRLPGGIDCPEAFWQALVDGRDLVGRFPSRWDDLDLYDPNPDAPGKSYVSEGAFIEGSELFDAAFFGMSAREAHKMDPQQRLVLETSWELLERAGIPPWSLNESLTGVYVGSTGSDYFAAGLAGGLESLDGYFGTGTLTSLLSGRVAYVLGLQGPALTVDTACSSSLTATHLACAALRRGECNLALAGGVTVMSTPGTFVEFCRLKGMAPDGRCKSFSARADGAGWGEGCAMLLLKRLSDAQRQGDRVLAVIRSSAVNQDGRSQGISAPNGPSQQRVIGEALAMAGLEPCDIDALEAHGTGTMLGDPIEAGALAAVFGPGRSAEQPLYLGSSKSNLGHTQAAAGVTGVIKMVLALQHELLPKTLHAEQPSEYVTWEESGLSLLQEPRAWKRGERVRRAGISSFGISGTNAHLVLEEAPRVLDTPESTPDAPALHVFLLSGRDERSLHAQAARWLTWLQAHPEQRFVDVVYSAALHRTHHETRAALVVSSAAECEAGLRALAEGRSHACVVTGKQEQVGKLACLFTGQGSQRPGMGRELYEHFPAFRTTLDEVDAALEPWLGCSIRELMFAPEGSAQSAQLDQTQFTQPALFALEVALYRQWQSWGVKPHALLGHSVGELSAAHVAGVLSLADAAKLVSARGRLMQACRADGAMVSLEASEQEVRAELELFPEVEIAGLNGPQQTVVSGTAHAVHALMERLRERGRRVRSLTVSHAFHSAHMDAMLGEFAAVAQSCSFQAPAVPLISLVSGQPAQGDDFVSAAYWVRQVRQAVRFVDGMQTLEALGCRQYLECGPEGTLCAMGAQCVSERTRFLTSLRAATGEARTIMTALGGLHSQGHAIDWPQLLRGSGGRLIDVPTYAFQRQPYWHEGGLSQSSARALGLRAAEHPLLGAQMRLAESDGYVFSTLLSLKDHAWLGDHTVFGMTLVPGTAMLELALHASRAVGLAAVRELTFLQPLQVSQKPGVQLQLCVASADEQGSRAITLHSSTDDNLWVQNATGVLQASCHHEAGAAFAELRSWPVDGSEPVDVGDLYPRLAELGFHYGPAFQGLRELRRSGRVGYARVVLPAAIEASAGKYGLHPALLDAALHTLFALQDQTQVMLPFSWSDVQLYATGASELRVRVELQRDDAVGMATASLTLSDSHGEPVASIGALRLRHAQLDELEAPQVSQVEDLYRLDLQAVPLELAGAAAAQAVLGGDGHLARVLGVPWYAELSALLPQEGARALPTRLIVDATSPTEGPLVPAVHASTTAALSLLQGVLAEPALAQTELVWVTRLAVDAGPDSALDDLAHAPLWGLVRGARMEHLERGLRLVDLGTLDVERELLQRGLSASHEPELVLRADTWSAPRLVHVARENTQEVPELNPEGTVLITGGTGELGAALAQHLVSRHRIKHLVLTSRRGLAQPGADALVARLSELGAVDVEVVAGDVTARAELQAVLSRIPSAHPLTGVFHLAAVLDDGMLPSQTAERLSRVLAPKVDGAWHLHELTRDLDLACFVLFSSAAGTIGSLGQSNYAAANVFLDALAAHRRKQGLVATSLAWGLWRPSGTGITGGLTHADLARLARAGITPMLQAEGLLLLDTALRRSEPQLIPIRLELGAMQRLFEQGVPPLWRKLIRPGLRRVAVRGSDASAARARVLALPDAARGAALLEEVRSEVAAVLGLSGADAVEPDRDLQKFGVDSLVAMELRNRFSALAGALLPVTVVFEHPTPRQMADWLYQHTFASLSAAPLEAAQSTPRESGPRELWNALRADNAGQAAADLLELSGEERARFAPLLERLSAWTARRSSGLSLVDRAADARVERSLSIAGRRHSVLSWGDPTDPAVLCIHGWRDQGLIWEELARHLIEQGLYVIAPDLRGHGLSESDVASGGIYSDFAADVLALCDQLGLKDAALVAHSFGGSVATACVLEQPSRFKCLCLIEPLVLTPDVRTWVIQSRTSEAPCYASESEALEMLAGVHPNMRPSLRQALVARSLKPVSDGRLVWCGDPNAISLDDLPMEQAYLELLEKVQVPAAVVYGEASPLVGAHQASLAARALGAHQLVGVPGAHWIHYEQAERVARVIAELVSPTMQAESAQ